MEDRIKKTEVWQKLIINPKFRQMLDECLKKYSYYVNPESLMYKVNGNKLIIVYNSKINNTDSKSQYKLFEQNEFFIDDNDNLIINGLSGRFESDRGFKFETTNGGIINTHYFCTVFDQDGIELAFERYDDRYSFDKIEYDSFASDFQNVILGAYNPLLAESVCQKGVYPYPKVIGKLGQFARQMRSIDNLGVVEVTRCSYSKDSRVFDKEYYFNVLPDKQAIYTPELIHIMHGKPFARLDDNSNMAIEEDYSSLGLTKNNYKEIARERFLKELQEGREKVYSIDELVIKYNMMISKLEVKEDVKRRTL